MGPALRATVSKPKPLFLCCSWLQQSARKASAEVVSHCFGLIRPTSIWLLSLVNWTGQYICPPSSDHNCPRTDCCFWSRAILLNLSVVKNHFSFFKIFFLVCYLIKHIQKLLLEKGNEKIYKVPAPAFMMSFNRHKITFITVKVPQFLYQFQTVASSCEQWVPVPGIHCWGAPGWDTAHTVFSPVCLLFLEYICIHFLILLPLVSSVFLYSLPSRPVK